MALTNENLFLIAWGIQTNKSPCQLGFFFFLIAMQLHSTYINIIPKKRKRQNEVIQKFCLGSLP